MKYFSKVILIKWRYMFSKDYSAGDAKMYFGGLSGFCTKDDGSFGIVHDRIRVTRWRRV